MRGVVAIARTAVRSSGNGDTVDQERRLQLMLDPPPRRAGGETGPRRAPNPRIRISARRLTDTRTDAVARAATPSPSSRLRIRSHPLPTLCTLPLAPFEDFRPMGLNPGHR